MGMDMPGPMAGQISEMKDRNTVPQYGAASDERKGVWHPCLRIDLERGSLSRKHWSIIITRPPAMVP